jgi:hypothetical protein
MDIQQPLLRRLFCAITIRAILTLSRQLPTVRPAFFHAGKSLEISPAIAEYRDAQRLHDAKELPHINFYRSELMNKLILLLVLISGFLSGYLIGDYRGRDARETLKKAAATGKALDSERETAITQLKTELGNINDKHQRELETIRKENAARASEWRRTKDTLDDNIQLSNTKITESDNRLKALVAKRDGTTGAEEARLNLEIAQLRKEREALRREIEGNTCLQTKVPHSVFEALNETKTAGGR